MTSVRGNLSFGVAEDRHADVGNSLDHSVVALVGWGQGGAWKHVDLDRAVGPFLDFLGPLGGQKRVPVCGRKENGVSKLYGFAVAGVGRHGRP